MNFCVSIVTPSYNQVRFLERTILSVLSQAGDFCLEYIIVDGGSTDGSVGIIKKYEGLLQGGSFPVRCKGIDYRWISEKDSGQAEAINKGLKMAKGEVWTYINSDDVLEPGTCAAVLEVFAEKPEVDVVYGSCRIIDENDGFVRMLRVGDFNLASLWEFNILGQQGVFLRRRVLERHGYFNQSFRYAFDYEYWLRISLGSRFYRIPRVNASFRIWKESKTGGGELKFKEEQIRILRGYFSREKKKTPPESVLKCRKRIFARYYGSAARHSFRERRFRRGIVYGLKAVLCYPIQLTALIIEYLTMGFER